MEITKALKISQQEEEYIELHSFLNVLSALVGTCTLIEIELDRMTKLESCTAPLRQLIDLLSTPHEFLVALGRVDSIRSDFFEHFDAFMQKNASPDTTPQLQAHRENLLNIFNVAAVRAQEMLERHRTANAWKTFQVEDIRANFLQFFGAVEKNANGRYRIINNIADHAEDTYLIHFKVNSMDNRQINCPSAIIDVMRDLIANARKYTEPGGRIDAGLSETEKEIRFVVQDSGRGIPEDEIEKVVDLGYRASNAKDRPTLGGGFGLTKAYQFVKRNGGRFWIQSSAGNGTAIRFTIPKQDQTITP